MPRTFPFSGLVFDPAVAGPLEVVTAPPYDVIGETERQAFLASSPYSVVHLDLSEGDGRDRYDRAAQLLHRWRAEGALVPLPEPSYLGYEMRFRFQARDRTIRGILCALELEEWGGSVLPHERTMPGPVEDRLRLLRATRVDLSAVYGTVAGPVPALASALERVSGGAPLATVVDAEGVTHRLWVVPHTPGLTEALAVELTPFGVGVSVINPGPVVTDFGAARGHPYDRARPKPIPAEAVADAVMAAVDRGRAEQYMPGWLRPAVVVRHLVPPLFRRGTKGSFRTELKSEARRR